MVENALQAHRAKYDCIFVEQRSDKVYYILRYIICSDDVLGGFKMKILTKLGKLEKEILKLKGRNREEAMKAYRKLLVYLKDEPIYFVRC